MWSCLLTPWVGVGIFCAWPRFHQKLVFVVKSWMSMYCGICDEHGTLPSQSINIEMSSSSVITLAGVRFCDPFCRWLIRLLPVLTINDTDGFLLHVCTNDFQSCYNFIWYDHRYWLQLTSAVHCTQNCCNVSTTSDVTDLIPHFMKFGIDTLSVKLTGLI